MKLSLAARIAIVGAACAAAAVPVMALAGAGRIAHPDASAVPWCSSQSTTTWLGLGNGGGTLGTTFYPVEFSNTGRVACSLSGYPTLFAVSGTGAQVGLPSVARGRRQLVVLQPGQTAHVVLGIVGADALSGCELRPGAFLKVVAP